MHRVNRGNIALAVILEDRGFSARMRLEILEDVILGLGQDAKAPRAADVKFSIHVKQRLAWSKADLCPLGVLVKLHGTHVGLWNWTS